MNAARNISILSAVAGVASSFISATLTPITFADAIWQEAAVANGLNGAASSAYLSYAYNQTAKGLSKIFNLDYNDTLKRIRHDNDKNYLKTNTRSDTCIDNLDIYIKIKNNIIEDITFDGEACVISTSTTNIMSNLLCKKTVDEAINIINNYNNMIEEKEYEKDLLEDAIVYDDISKQPNRIKCATLSWNGLYKELKKYKENNKGVKNEL